MFIVAIRHYTTIRLLLDTTGTNRQQLIPSRPPTGCPSGTVDGITTCFCEDHCSWSICRLKNPPKSCPGVESWKMNSFDTYWIAQGKK